MSINRKQSGFTLVELLISLSIIAVVMALCASGFRFGIKVWDRVGTRIEWVEEAYAARRVLTAVISQAVAPKENDDEEAIEVNSYFIGEPQRLRLIANAPIVGTDDYLYQYDMHFNDAAGTFEISHAPFSYRDTTGEQRSSILAKNIANVRFQYFGPDLNTGELTWNSNWQGPEIPLLVGVSTTTQGQGLLWPDIVIELKSGAYVVR